MFRADFLFYVDLHAQLVRVLPAVAYMIVSLGELFQELRVPGLQDGTPFEPVWIMPA